MGRLVQQLPPRRADRQNAARRSGGALLCGTGSHCPGGLIRSTYLEVARRCVGAVAPAVAVRSGATTKELPQARFVRQQESFLNGHGEQELLDICHRARIAIVETTRRECEALMLDDAEILQLGRGHRAPQWVIDGQLGFLAEILAELTPGTDLATVSDEAELRDALDLDLMDCQNFVSALHERTGQPIPEADYPCLGTLAGVIAYLAEF